MDGTREKLSTNSRFFSGTKKSSKPYSARLISSRLYFNGTLISDLIAKIFHIGSWRTLPSPSARARDFAAFRPPAFVDRSTNSLDILRAKVSSSGARDWIYLREIEIPADNENPLDERFRRRSAPGNNSGGEGCFARQFSHVSRIVHTRRRHYYQSRDSATEGNANRRASLVNYLGLSRPVSNDNPFAPAIDIALNKKFIMSGRASADDSRSVGRSFARQPGSYSLARSLARSPTR